MIFFHKQKIRLMAAALAGMLLTMSAPVQAESVEPPANESFFEIIERREFSEKVVFLENENVLQIEAAVDAMGCELARYILSEDGKTLLRTEYYDIDGRLAFISEVLDYDFESKSYTEKIYIVDIAANTQTLWRTDTYANGALTEQVVYAEMPLVTTPAPTTPKETEVVSAPTAPAETESTQVLTTPTATEAAPAPMTSKASTTPTTPRAVKLMPVQGTSTAPRATKVILTPKTSKEMEALRKPVMLEETEPAQAPTEPPKKELVYDRTKSIYGDDGETLVRVEYYDRENKLVYYSSVENYDSNTKSYTEYIYSYDWDTDTEILERTDVYVNGQLQGSSSPSPTPTVPEETEPAQVPTEAPKKDLAYDRTNFIYGDDRETLIRVEYYNRENRLVYYSSVEDYDSNTKSYTEYIYSYDWDTDTEILERTDVYVNGQLQGNGGNPSPAPTVPEATEPTSEPTVPEETEPTTAPTEAPKKELAYDRTNSIYSDDKEMLLRVEYYNRENRLVYYSSVEDYDSDTKSYTEYIYSYDWDTDTETLERTDVYVNGQLQGSSDTP